MNDDADLKFALFPYNVRVAIAQYDRNRVNFPANMKPSVELYTYDSFLRRSHQNIPS